MWHYSELEELVKFMRVTWRASQAFPLKYVVDISPGGCALAKQHGAQATVSETVFSDASVEAVVIASKTRTRSSSGVPPRPAGRFSARSRSISLSSGPAFARMLFPKRESLA
jgi:hypothetical protein